MDKLSNYLKESLPINNRWEQLERYAIEHRVPIMDSVSMHFLLTLLQISKPDKILEVGTAIGYSALRMAEQLPYTHITTLERNEDIAKIALRNIKDAGCDNQIQLILGDALISMEQLKQANKGFDVIFIDAAKGQYEHFFQLADKLLHPQGLIICDNILFRGFVAETSIPDQKRLKKIAEKLQNFNNALMNNPTYTTSIIPVGDGISLSVKN